MSSNEGAPVRAPSARARALEVAGWAVTCVAAWVWFCSMATASWDRVRTLKCVENYALAVYDQLIYNYATRGEWTQTIHFGYDDTWTWSGHHSVWIFPVAWLYSLAPGPLMLPRIQIAAVALGALAAHALGRKCIGGPVGGVLGAAVYLAYPPLQAVALNDYQDLILGTPFAIAAFAANRYGNRVAYALAALACVCAREEWVVVMAMLPFSTPGSLKKKATEGLIGLGILLPYVIFLASHRVKSTGHDTPMFSQIQSMLVWPPPFTRSWADVETFYRLFLSPTQILGLAAPLSFAMALPALFFHATADARGGVDTQWSGHIHHMAPIAAILCAATIEGIGNLVRFARAGRVWRAGAILVAASALVWWNARAVWPLVQRLSLRTEWTVVHRESPPDAPEWALLTDNQVPTDDAVCTDVYGSILVSSRPRSYTYDESLRDKAMQEEIRACDWMLVRKSDSKWMGRAAEARASVKVAETKDYALFRLPWP